MVYHLVPLIILRIFTQISHYSNYYLFRFTNMHRFNFEFIFRILFKMKVGNASLKISLFGANPILKIARHTFPPRIVEILFL